MMTHSVCRAICRLSESLHGISISSRNLHVSRVLAASGSRVSSDTGSSLAFQPASVSPSTVLRVQAASPYNASQQSALPLSPSLDQSILDVYRNWKISYDCPTNPHITQDIDTPPLMNIIIPLECPVIERPDKTNPDPAVPSKQARRIQKIRHEKMKKHQRKKFKKKHVAWLRKLKFQRARNRERKLVKHLESFKIFAQQFDAKNLFKEELDLARRQGYSINMLDSFAKGK